MDDTLSFADKQTCVMVAFIDYSMLEAGCNPPFLRYNARFKIRQKLLGLMALHLAVLNGTTSKSCIQFHSLDGCSASFILFIQKI